MKRTKERFGVYAYLLFTLALAGAMLLAITVGSAVIPLFDTLRVIAGSLYNAAAGLLKGLLEGINLESWSEAIPYAHLPDSLAKSIVIPIRVPRVFCTAMTGAALSLAGAAMQGLLRNPLADGSTLGVSSGASLGAVIAIAFGVAVPGLSFGGTMALAMLFAFLSLMIILSLAYALDKSLSTHSIILIGVIFSMFASSLISLIIAFAGEKVKAITFWTMGSLAGSSYEYAGILFAALFLCGFAILKCAGELNAFAVGEDNARNIGVNVSRVKLIVLIAVSVLIGVAVSVGGTIGFVGLVVPHMARMLVGPNHKKLLPASMYFGSIFLLLADLAARTILSPVELPIGVITSLVGSVIFVAIFYRTRKGR